LENLPIEFLGTIGDVPSERALMSLDGKSLFLREFGKVVLTPSTFTVLPLVYKTIFLTPLNFWNYLFLHPRQF
jgi:hypothetical protein